jgi:hypothetical protein
MPKVNRKPKLCRICGKDAKDAQGRHMRYKHKKQYAEGKEFELLKEG